MASEKLQIEVISPEGIAYEGEIDELIIPTSQGEIAVLPNHAALFTKLAEGEAVLKIGDKAVSIAISGGFLEIINNSVKVLSDLAIRAENIEIAKVEEARKRAEEIIAGKISTEDFTLAEKELQRSIVALKVAEKMRKRRRA